MLIWGKTEGLSLQTPWEKTRVDAHVVALALRTSRAGILKSASWGVTFALCLQIQTRIANEKYLRTHKEVELLISGFFREMFLERPDNVREFASDYFTDPRLPNKIHLQLIKEKKAA
ncbi:RIIa domain-containing protein 1 isoform X1 [Pteropus medius]|uniref:RIIa domain-containing protein 1 isoform X1 n=1 Tax=Pteropus vampyrus TaxID=132908 RepID=UPI00196A2B79|nr:RIIa domain-containing protein 1 isoform X1 [Pteropus giganteus]XP_039697568.1 RIIa domain-containing protein 1 isoform X1 [Pteropus giganteus]